MVNDSIKSTITISSKNFSNLGLYLYTTNTQILNIPSQFQAAFMALYILLGTNVLKATNLLLTHGRHNTHNQIFTLTKSILDLHHKNLKSVQEGANYKTHQSHASFVTIKVSFTKPQWHCEFVETLKYSFFQNQGGTPWFHQSYRQSKDALS